MLIQNGQNQTITCLSSQYCETEQLKTDLFDEKQATSDPPPPPPKKKKRDPKATLIKTNLKKLIQKHAQWRVELATSSLALHFDNVNYTISTLSNFTCFILYIYLTCNFVILKHILFFFGRRSICW